MKNHLSNNYLLVKMEFITTQKGQRKILLEGYLYVKQKNLANGVESYECEKRRQNNCNQGECRAIIKVLGDRLIDKLHEHTHGPSPSETESRKIMCAIKHRAEETNDTAQQILTQAAVISTEGM